MGKGILSHSPSPSCSLFPAEHPNLPNAHLFSSLCPVALVLVEFRRPQGQRSLWLQHIPGRIPAFQFPGYLENKYRGTKRQETVLAKKRYEELSAFLLLEAGSKGRYGIASRTSNSWSYNRSKNSSEAVDKNQRVCTTPSAGSLLVIV